MKVGRIDVHEDAERVHQVRQAVGERFMIACDANQAWSPEQAIDFCRLVESDQICWLEEPCHWYDDLAGMRRVRGRTGIPVTAGQSEITKYGCEALVRGGAVDILNVDVSHAGGITEWRKIAAYAAAHSLPMAPHGNPHVGAHCVAGVRNGLIVEVGMYAGRAPARLPMLAPLAVDRGEIQLTETPGFGFEIDRDAIKWNIEND
jgi:D-arabinonate dehydratase